MSQNEKDLQYAFEVLEVYRSLGDMSSECNFRTSSAKKLYEWASNEPNQEKFFSQMVPKATELIQKHRETETPDEIVKAENKSIAELRVILLEEVEKSRMSPIS